MVQPELTLKWDREKCTLQISGSVPSWTFARIMLLMACETATERAQEEKRSLIAQPQIGPLGFPPVG